MTRVDIYLDPACPWCWATSRWLVNVAAQRELRINWLPFSLWRKNRDTFSPEYLAAVFRTHRWLRVFESVREAHGNDAVGALYTVVATALHHDVAGEVDIRAGLEAAGLDWELARAADDESWDAGIAAAMDAALAMTGNDVGTPLLAFDGKAAFFGPLVSPVPTGEAAVELFDAVHTLATMDGFRELKRIRAGGPALPERPQVPRLTELQIAS